MNWKKASENWEKFIQTYNLDVEINDRNYFHGKQKIFQAKETYNDYNIFYENKLNKSNYSGASYNFGHKIMVIVPIKPNNHLKLKIKKSSFWKRLNKRNKDLSIITNKNEIKNLLPLNEIRDLLKNFSDLKISIESYNRYQNPYINFGQKVIQLESKRYPTELKQHELSRTIIIKILDELKNRKLINACTEQDA